MNRNKINSFILLVISTCAINQASASSFSTKDSLGCVPLVTKFKSTVSNAKSWNWNFGNGNTSTAQNPTEVFINGGDYTVTLEVEKNDGTSIKIVKANFIKAINEPTIVAVVSDSNLCQNSNYVQLKNNTQGTNHFLWDFGDGKFSETTSPLHHFSSPGDYTINVIATNSYGCSSNKKIGNINIQEMPNRVIQIISQNTSCDSSSLFEFKTLFFEKNEYLWKFDDLSDLTGNQITKVFSGYGKQNVTLITKNSSGCLDTTLLDPIIDIKKSNYNIDVSSEKECKGNSIDFNMNGVNIEKVEWSFSDGHKGFGKSISRDFSINGKYNLTATVTSLSGCLTKISRNNIVEIGNGPNASFHLKDSAICLGSELALSQSANLYSSIMWDFGDGQFSQEKRPKHTYDKKGQFSIKLIVKMGTCADTISKKIMVSKPKASFTNKGIYACAPVDVQFKNTSTDSKKHQWIFSNGISSNKPNPKVKFLHAKNYNATLIAMDSYGCADTLILDSVVKIVNNAPNNFKHTTVRGCAPLSFLLANFSTGTKEWTWDFGDGHFSEKSIPEHTYSSSGDYVVSLSTRNASGCAFTIDTIAVVKSQNIKLDSLEISMNCDENILSATIKCEECKNLNWNVEDSIYNSEEIKHHFANADSNLITISGKSSLGCMTKASYLIKADSCSVQQIIEPQIVTGNANPPLWIKNKNDTLLNSPDFYKGCRPLKTITINPRPDADWWLWDFGDGNTSTQKNPIHEYNSIGSFSLTLFYSQLGIKDTLYLNNFANVHGHENNIQVTSSEHCFDLKLQMQASDPSLMEYSWMIDDKIQSSSSYKIDTLFKNSTQVHIVTVTTSDTNYCNFSKSMAIVASNALPLFQFRDKICHGDSTVIEHNIQNKYTLKWSFGDGNTSTEFDVGHKYENP
ncbi:MAG: PKD repeat protein, partial [Saprospiraceae bacterium]